MNEEIQSELANLGINVYDKEFYAEEDDSVENKPNAFMVNMKVIDNSSLRVIILEGVSVLLHYITLFLIIKYGKKANNDSR